MWSVLAVDNGKAGAVAIYTPKLDRLLLAPTPSRSGRLATRLLHQEADEVSPDYDFIAMRDLVTQALELSDCALVAVIEEPPAGMAGPSSRASLMDQYRGMGLWQAAMVSNGIEAFTVNSRSWKAALGLLKTPKEYTLVKAAELRPREVWEVVDAADAFLIAYYAAHCCKQFAFLLD